MRNNHRVADEFNQVVKYVLNWRRIHDHDVGNAREHHNERRNGATWVDQRVEAGDFFSTLILHCANFGDAANFG